MADRVMTVEYFRGLLLQIEDSNREKGMSNNAHMIHLRKMLERELGVSEPLEPVVSAVDQLQARLKAVHEELKSTQDQLYTVHKLLNEEMKAFSETENSEQLVTKISEYLSSFAAAIPPVAETLEAGGNRPETPVTTAGDPAAAPALSPTVSATGTRNW